MTDCQISDILLPELWVPILSFFQCILLYCHYLFVSIPSDVPNLVVIVTDGESNINPIETLPEANRIKRSGTSIITVAVGLTSNAELVGLTSPPIAENLIYVDDFEALGRLSDQIVAPLCSGKRGFVLLEGDLQCHEIKYAL